MATTSSAIDLVNGDTKPSAPVAGSLSLYVKNGTAFTEDSSGTETPLVNGVTAVSVVSANGLAGTVANSTSTPAITLSTTITGILKGNGTAINTAVAGDFPTLNQNTSGNAATATLAATVTTNANLTGPVTSSGNATSVTANAITNAMLATVLNNTVKGNVSGSTGNASDLTATQVTALLNAATTSLQGAQSASDKSKSDNWYNKVVYNVLDNGISTANSGATNSTAIAALLTTIVDNATIYFPPSGTPYQFASTISIPSGKHLRFQGGGNQKSIIQTTSATADIVLVGDWFNEFHGLYFTSSVTRTAGAAINSGNNVAVNVFDCDFSSMFNGITYTGGASAGNLAIVRHCNFTGTLNWSIQMDGQNANAFILECVADGTAGLAQAHVYVNQCGSLLIANCDFIRAVNNLYLNPDSGTKGVFSVYCTNVFFDTATGSSVKFGGAGTTNIQRTKFVNCWFSSSVNGCEFASTATSLPTAIDFVNCDIFANSANGILATAVQDFSVNSCRISGNTTSGINLVASAGSVTKFNIQNSSIGPTAGFGGNGIGVNIQSGTYGSYNVTGNIVAGNTSNNNILDVGSVATTDLKVINGNTGHLLKGAVASQGATALSVPITTETVVLSARIPANCVIPGQVFRIKTMGVMSGANTVTWKVRIGAAGTTADTAVWTPTTSAAGAVNLRHGCEVYLTVRASGASATANAEGLQQSATTAILNTFQQPVAGAATTTSFVSNAAFFITVTLAQGIGTTLVQQAVIEAL